LINSRQIYLSSWELNRKSPHPKHIENIINYLGYIPQIKFSFEKLGTRTKLYRIKNKLSIQEFSQLNNIDINILDKLENSRSRKSSLEEQSLIENILKNERVPF
jgi:transcriptional regulator with XRE-family HTH domain